MAGPIQCGRCQQRRLSDSNSPRMDIAPAPFNLRSGCGGSSSNDTRAAHETQGKVLILYSRADVAFADEMELTFKTGGPRHLGRY